MPLSIPSNWLSATLVLADLVLASANVIIGFSLLAYILTHNLRSPAAQAFSALLAFLTIVYAADVVVSNVISAGATLAQSVPMSPGQVEIEATVTATYRLVR